MHMGQGDTPGEVRTHIISAHAPGAREISARYGARAGGIPGYHLVRRRGKTVQRGSQRRACVDPWLPPTPRLALLAHSGPRRRRPGPSMARRGLRRVGPLSGSAGGAMRQGRGRVAVRGRREQGRGRDGARVLAVPLAPHIHLRGGDAHLEPEGAEEVLVARGHGRRVGGDLVGLGLGVGGKG